MSSKSKTVFITGATSGIGSAIAMAFAGAGNRFILSGRNQPKLLELSKRLEQQGSEARAVIADLGDQQDIRDLIKGIVKTEEKIDVLVHAAGIWHDDNRTFSGIDYQDFDRKVIKDTLSVGLVAPALLVHGLLPIMSKDSSLIAISGTFESGAKGWLPYYVSKRGLEDLWLGLSQELEDKGIRVYCVSPSDTSTEAYAKYFPEYLADSISPDVIASQVLHLVTDNPAPKEVVWVVKKDHDPFPVFHA